LTIVDTPRLLWPQGKNEETFEDKELHRKSIEDLGIDNIVRIMSDSRDDFIFIKQHLIQLCSDPEVIKFRLDILQDIVNNENILEVFEDIIPLIEIIEGNQSPGHIGRKSESTEWKHRKIVWRVETLEAFSEIVSKIYNTLSSYRDNLISEGLINLYEYLKEIVEGEDFKSLVEKLPDFKEEINRLSGVIIGVNLNSRLEPVEAVFLDVKAKPFRDKPLLAKLFNLEEKDSEVFGISQFHSIEKDNSTLERHLYKDLEEIFEKILTPVEKALNAYAQLKVPFILKLKNDICFFSGAFKMIKKLKSAGIKMCRPRVEKPRERICEIDNLVEINLALELLKEELDKDDVEEEDINIKPKIVPNDIKFNSEGRIFILTGPNQGGKTTFTRSIGITQILFQAGLFIPASEARISPVDIVYTHFSEKEKISTEDGRLGEESRRLSWIFRNISSDSLLLMNESLSSTSPGESLYLLKDIVKALRILGCRAVFTTHLHRLAESIDEINTEIEGESKVKSLVAEVERKPDSQAKRTYKIKPKPPEGMSFARDIAEKYGISFDRLQDIIEKSN